MGKSKKMIKSIILYVWNWLEIRCMRMRGYSPTTFNPYTNKYEYELKSEVDKRESEENQPFEIFGYNKENVELPWCYTDKSKEKARIKKNKSLSRGECTDQVLYRRNAE
jgi:hypothetical protein